MPTDPDYTDYESCYLTALHKLGADATTDPYISDVVEITIANLRKLGWTPHYTSTYCMHENHAECKIDCKTCHKKCLCDCHAEIVMTPM